MRRPFFIDKNLKVFAHETNNARKVAAQTDLLYKDEQGSATYKYSWNYRSVISMFNLTICKVLPGQTLQWQYMNVEGLLLNPRLSHERAMLYLSRYLKGTSAEKVIIFDPDVSRGI